MLRILLLAFIVLLAACIEEPPAASTGPGPLDGDAGSDLSVADAGMDARPADDMVVVPDARMPDMGLECPDCPGFGEGAFFTSCEPCAFACEPEYEQCENSCAMRSQNEDVCGICSPVACTEAPANAFPVCTDALECSFECEDGFRDTNQDPADGCECSIGADDLGNGVDENCDGVDGLADDFIFVTNEAGDDANDGYSPATPVASLDAAVEAARSAGRETIVLEGTPMPYASSVVLESESMRIIGGWSVDANGLWTEGNSRSSLATMDPTTPVLSVANLGDLDFVGLENLDIRGPNQPVAGAAAYTMRIENVSSQTSLVFTNVRVRGGTGGDGRNGTHLGPGDSGGNGTKGADATQASQGPAFNPGGNGGDSTCGSDGGDGGAARRCSNAGSADPGQPGLLNGSDATTFGNGGNNACVVGALPGAGGRGNAGRAGDGGRAVSKPSNPRGTFDADLVWQPPVMDPAQRGAHGAGGGGGGGGGTPGGPVAIANSNLGPGGSGGGAGGCGAPGGNAGQPGGASIALAIRESNLSLGSLEIVMGRGGEGGDGADGGCGGDGGAAGALATGSGDTGSPGAGGNGGNGGSGAGGNGGPGGFAFGLVTLGGSVDSLSASITGGSNAPGGLRGRSGFDANGNACSTNVGDDGQEGDDGQPVNILEL